MKYGRKYLICILAVLLLAQTGCGNTAAEPNDNAAAEENPAQTEAITETEPQAEVPEADYGGTTYDILTCGNWAADWTEIYEFQATELTGEAINDAVYQRNLMAEEKYNIVISEIHNMGSTGATGKGRAFVQNSVQASDQAYDLVLMGTYDCAPLAAEGYLLNLKSDVPYVNLQKPWWDQKVVEDLALGGKMFYATGDLTMIDNDCTFCLLFNKQMIVDYALDDPYTLVKEGDWTIDRFVQMASQVSVDVDGDGKYTEADTYGYCIWHEAMRGMVNACGGRFCALTDKNEMELTFLDERTIDMLSRFSVLAYDRSLAYSTYHSPDKIEEMFANDQVLFYSRYLCIIKKYRDMETDFGILPYPKYDEAQKDYYSSVSPYGCSFVCVPVVVENPEMTGAVLEYMACESRDIVTPAYYDVTLQGKILRDEESTEMLDIILSSRVFDLGWYYEIGGYHVDLLKLFYNSSLDFVSMYEKNKAKALEEIAAVNANFAN